MPDLYPSFDVPEEMIEEIEQETEEVPSPLLTAKYDFENMKVVIEPNGSIIKVSDHETYKQWVLRCLLTERYLYMAYGDDFGVEIEDIIRSNYPRDVAESEIQRTITETLEIDPRTLGVDEFSFEWKGDSAHVSFIVESIYGQEEVVMEIGGETVGRVRYP